MTQSKTQVSVAGQSPVTPAGARGQNQTKKPANHPGVGGDSDETFVFKIGVLDKSKVALDERKTVRMELAPARRSSHDKSGQQAPGSGFGMELRTRVNLAKMPIPGARPCYQNMGIAEETLDWVGAFIGFDTEIEASADYENLGQGWRTDVKNAWDQSNSLYNIFRKGQELGIELSWNSKHREEALIPERILFDPKKSTIFTGYIKEFARSYATEQRVYYRISFVVTNTQDQQDLVNEDVSLLQKSFANFIDGGIAIGMPKPEDAAKLKQNGREVTALNGHSKKDYEDLANKLSDPQKVNRILSSLRNPNGSAYSVEQLKEVKESIQVFLNNKDFIVRNKDISLAKDGAALSNSMSILKKTLESNSSPELRTAVDGIESIVDRRSNLSYTPILLYF